MLNSLGRLCHDNQQPCIINYIETIKSELYRTGVSESKQMIISSTLTLDIFLALHIFDHEELGLHLQVREIKQRFEKNMRDLHLIYLRSSKHGKFGLSCFWRHLNYNEYYAEDSNQYALS